MEEEANNVANAGHPIKIAAQAQILLEAAGLAQKLGKAPIGYRIIDDVGHPHFISVDEYNRLKEEAEQYEAQQSLYYPPIETPSGIITSTSSEHMQGIRKSLGMEAAKPAYNPAVMAALAAMDNTAFPAKMPTEEEPKLRKKTATLWELEACGDENGCTKCTAAAEQVKKLNSSK